MQGFTLDIHFDPVTGHFVSGIPARPDRDIQRTGIDDVVCIIPAKCIADLNRRTGPIGLMPSGVGPIVQEAILDVDQAGETHLRQHLFLLGLVLHHPKEDLIRFDHIAAMHQGHPVIQPLLQRAFQADRLLILPVNRRRRRSSDLPQIAAVAGVMAGRLIDLLFPDIQTAAGIFTKLFAPSAAWRIFPAPSGSDSASRARLTGNDHC